MIQFIKQSNKKIQFYENRSQGIKILDQQNGIKIYELFDYDTSKEWFNKDTGKYKTK